MSVHAEAIIDTAAGTLLVRDALADTSADQRAAARASGISGRRGGRMLGAAGTVLQVRCAHQFSRTSVRIEVLTAPAPPGDGPWQWEEPLPLGQPSSRRPSLRGRASLHDYLRRHQRKIARRCWPGQHLAAPAAHQ